MSGASRYADVELEISVLCRETFSFMNTVFTIVRYLFDLFAVTCVFSLLIVIGSDRMLHPRDIDRGGNSISIVDSVCPKIALM